jgi:peptide/nickel transport system substrate-binding protein
MAIGRHFRVWGRPAAIACLLAVVVAANAAASPVSKAKTTRINIRLPYDVNSFDPQVANSDASVMAQRFAYDTLVANVNGKIVPELASKWQVTPTFAKFWLRKDATCSDGSKLTAGDVASTVGRLVDKNTKSPSVRTQLGGYDITAAANNRAGTFTLKLATPYGDLISGIARMAIICHAGLKNPDLLKTRTFGTGPYMLTESVSGDHYTFTKRKGYKWGPDGSSNDQAPDKVVLRVILNETTATNAFLTGGLDVTLAVGPDRARLEKNKSLFKLVVPAQEWNIFLNHREGRPASDVNVRKGLVASIKRSDLAAAMGGQFGRAPDTLLLPDSPCQDPEEVKSIIPYDPNAAKRYFAAAGYQVQGGKLTKDGQPLTLKVLVPSQLSPVADYLVAMWGQQGVNVSPLVAPQSQTDVTTVTGGDWDVSFVTVSNHYPAYISVALMGPPFPTGFNFSAINNATYTKLATEARVQPSQDVCNLWRSASRAIEANADVVPAMYVDVAYFGRKVTFTATSSIYGIYPASLRKT